MFGTEETRKVKETTAKLQEMNKKRQQAEEKFTKIKSVHVPKLAKTRDTVFEICEALKKIREDTDLLPDMFKKEKKVNTEYKQFVDEA